MKSLIVLVLVLLMKEGRAQTLEMRKGQPFPFGTGLALSIATVDSTKAYVNRINSELVEEKAKNLDLSMRLRMLTLEHNNQTVGYQGLQSSYANLTADTKEFSKVKRRRFWLGFGLGVITTSLINYANSR